MSKKKNAVYVKTEYIIFFMVGLLVVLAGSVFLFTNNSETTRSSENEILNSTISIVGPDQFSEEVAEEDVVILDIRTPEEFATGRIPNAVNIDYYNANFASTLAELDKEVEYKVYCNSGNRSASAVTLMKELGFRNVTELDGGIQAWNAFDLPTCIDC